MKRIGAFLVILAVVLGSAGCSGGKDDGKAGGGGRLNAGGSSFIDPLMQQWISTYKKEKGVEINYQPQGSGFGVLKMTSKELDIGFSDFPMNQEQLDKAKTEGGNAIHIPMAMGGVVPVYNLEEVKEPIVFSGPVLADIFMGKITTWNAKPLQDLNASLKLPDREIQVVHRSDKSGTTFVFTDYLSKVSAEWKKEVGAGPAVKWKKGVGAEQNPGVAAQVGRTPGSIGYVEVIYALGEKKTFGNVINKAGKPIRASLESVSAAAAAMKEIPENLCYSLTDAEGADAYPIVGTVWAIVYEKQSAGKKQRVVDFLRWAIHQGQEKCQDLKYARIPARIVEMADRKIDKIHD